MYAIFFHVFVASRVLGSHLNFSTIPPVSFKGTHLRSIEQTWQAMVEMPRVALMVEAAMTLRTIIDLTTISEPPHADVILPIVGAMPVPITIIVSATSR
jgi:hypothetical protein